MHHKTYDGAWFIYDGDCPLCRNAAQALRLKESLGGLNLLDARDGKGHPLLAAIRARGLDLDEGMVIYHQGRYFHGRDAMHFMALYGAPKGLFNRFNRLLFKKPAVAARIYPLLRGVRNLLLSVLGRGKIDNLTDREAPTFKAIFGAAWHTLPQPFIKHYRNRPYSRDSFRVSGTMSVRTSPLLRAFAPLSRALGGIPLVNANDIPVTVDFESEAGGRAFHFNRLFHLPGGKPWRFHSRMVPTGGTLGDGRMVEEMKFRLGWRVHFRFTEGRVRLHHDGYALCLFGQHIPLPLGWLIGSVEAEEWITGEDRFDMCVHINHPLFGQIYEYRGSFDTSAIPPLEIDPGHG